jgi:hypothetical protein
MTPLEKQAEHYAHNHFEMHENHYKGLKQGFIAGVESDIVKIKILKAKVDLLEWIEGVCLDETEAGEVSLLLEQYTEQIKKLEDANKI